jgi:hypothetical protein
MSYLMKKLLVAAALVTATVTTTAAAATAQSGALFDGFGKGVAEDTALAGAESAARQNALVHGFTACDVFESVVSQDARTRVFFAVVTVRCEDEAVLG